jgi:hypothetical protein
MQLTFSAEGQSWPIRLNDRAQRTQRALLNALPMALQLHTPKIAGSHIYWHAPIVEDVEGATHVLDAKPGAFIYWPVRQFLEITFAPLQAENAEITVLGELEAPAAGIAELAAVLKRDAGRRTLSGNLDTVVKHTVDATPASGLPQSVTEARRKLWAACPADILTLTNSRQIMHPVGPVLFAESEARVLHELLWQLRAEQSRRDEEVLRQSASIILTKTAMRLRDFCHLNQTSELLFKLAGLMDDPALPFGELIDEAILNAGRIAAWLDLLIPWNDLNQAFRQTLN